MALVAGETFANDPARPAMDVCNARGIDRGGSRAEPSADATTCPRSPREDLAMPHVVTGRPAAASSAVRPFVLLVIAALAGGLLIGAKPGGGGGTTAQVRINQVGFASAGGKRAYLMS